MDGYYLTDAHHIYGCKQKENNHESTSNRNASRRKENEIFQKVQNQETIRGF